MTTQGYCNHATKAEYFEFFIHGTKQKVFTNSFSPETTLNDYIRHHLGLTGTKTMCKQGGCGACVVAVTVPNPRTQIRETFAVNSCLVSILSCSGWDITTIEKLGNRIDGYHKIQKALVEFNGTQCGFCSPGMVMNMYALMEAGKNKMAEIENAFGGQTCRCTGYRSILDAFKSLATDHKDYIPDIEDVPFCKVKNCEKSCLVPCSVPKPVIYNLKNLDDNVLNSMCPIWYKVSKIAEIFEIFERDENRNRNYNLVAGNTAHGVYKDMAKADYYIDIREVAELQQYTLSTKNLAVGANCTLTDVMVIFKDVSQRDDGFKYLVKLVDHLDLIANVPVRNIGTLAGNLCIKYHHNEFPSDVFLLLETVNAKIIIDSGSSTKSYTPQNFLNINLTHKIIRRIEFPPFDGTYHLETYKIMPRAQNTHAFINAGFLFRLPHNYVPTEVTIVYGGINPFCVHATKAEKFLRGKDILNNNNLTRFFQILASELNPDHVLPDPSPEYRKQLAISLAYKYILSLVPQVKLPETLRSGSEKLHRGLSHGVQEYKVQDGLLPIGKPIHKLEALDQVSGLLEYPFDIPDAPRQLYGVFVYGNYPPGSKLTEIDTSNAMVSGVKEFFKAEDIPGVNSFVAPAHPLFYLVDEPLFVPIGDTLKFYGQPVGLIVADTIETATIAAGLVEVSCIPSNATPLLSIPDVIKNGATDRIHHVSTMLSKVVDLQDAPIQIEGTLNIGPQYHYHMEMYVVQVIPKDGGGLDVLPSTQWIDGVQFAIADLLTIPANKVYVSVRRVGGAFGAKITRANLTACAAALAAHKLNRPVKMSLTMEETMSVIGKRNPTYGTYQVGVDPNGKIMSLEQKTYTDVGAYENCIPSSFALDAYMNSYINTSFEVENNYVLTDTPSNTWMRAPGAVEGLAMIETIIEHIAFKLGKDPVDIRLLNLNKDKNPLLEKMINDFLSWSEYRSRKEKIKRFNEANRWRKKGLSMVPMAIGLEFIGTFHSHISIYHADGSVCVSHGGVEMGQGINTKVSQTVAHELEIPMEMVSILPTNSMSAPNNFASGASITTESVCRSVIQTCRILKQRIEEARTKAGLPDSTSWKELIQNASDLGVNLAEQTMFVNDTKAPSDYKIYGVAATEVEIDLLTGQYILQRVDIMEDVGDSSNPYIDIGQVEGAYVMGSGYWTTEKIVYDYDGRLLTNNSWEYLVPGAKDIPVDFRVKLPSGQPNKVSPFNNKVTSEPPTCLAFTVCLAIKEALQSGRKQANPDVDAWIPVDGPFSIDSIFMNCMNNFIQYRV